MINRPSPPMKVRGQEASDCRPAVGGPRSDDRMRVTVVINRGTSQDLLPSGPTADERVGHHAVARVHRVQATQHGWEIAPGRNGGRRAATASGISRSDRSRCVRDNEASMLRPRFSDFAAGQPAITNEAAVDDPDVEVLTRSSFPVALETTKRHEDARGRAMARSK